MKQIILLMVRQPLLPFLVWLWKKFLLDGVSSLFCFYCQCCLVEVRWFFLSIGGYARLFFNSYCYNYLPCYCLLHIMVQPALKTEWASSSIGQAGLCLHLSLTTKIWSFSADCRPGTKKLSRLSPWESEPSLFPKDLEKLMISPSMPISNLRTVNHSFPLCLPAAIGEYSLWLSKTTMKIQRILASPDDDDNNDEFN